jgi:peptidoglycan hydrolase CwlO-like protein
VPEIKELTNKRSELSNSVVTSKKQLATIREVEHKVQNRVKYLSKEEERMLGKIAVMQQRLDSRQHVFQ